MVISNENVTREETKKRRTREKPVKMEDVIVEIVKRLTLGLD